MCSKQSLMFYPDQEFFLHCVVECQVYWEAWPFLLCLHHDSSLCSLPLRAGCWVYIRFKLAWGEPGPCVWIKEVSTDLDTLTDTHWLPWHIHSAALRPWNQLDMRSEACNAKLTSSSKLKRSLCSKIVHCIMRFWLLNASPQVTRQDTRGDTGYKISDKHSPLFWSFPNIIDLCPRHWALRRCSDGWLLLWLDFNICDS